MWTSSRAADVRAVRINVTGVSVAAEAEGPTRVTRTCECESSSDKWSLVSQHIPYPIRNITVIVSLSPVIAARITAVNGRRPSAQRPAPSSQLAIDSFNHPILLFIVLS